MTVSDKVRHVVASPSKGSYVSCNKIPTHTFMYEYSDSVKKKFEMTPLTDCCCMNKNYIP
jgi:hypothetical protein